MVAILRLQTAMAEDTRLADSLRLSSSMFPNPARCGRRS